MIVLDQFPRKGRLSSYDKVTLVLAKPLDGVVPKVTGLSLDGARRRLQARGLVAAIERYAKGRAGRVLAQTPDAGVAAAPHMKVKLVVGLICRHGRRTYQASLTNSGVYAIEVADERAL